MVVLNLVEKFLKRMTNRQDEKSPCREISVGWKFEDNLTSPRGKTSPNSNLNYRHAFFAEDSCSNDFFYDEEFAIPFDANLTDQREPDDDDDFLPHHHPHFGIATSKSDNCLLRLGDLDQPESDNGEASGSEQEMFSSSDSSGLFNQPLFSSHSECPDEFALEASEDQDSVIDEELPKDVRKQSQVKHHYKISFDRGPLKVWSSSDEPASKTSLELRPNRAAHKPSTLSFQRNGEKQSSPSSSSQKFGGAARKSKKKFQQKNSTTWNSKSSHLVTWGTITNSPQGSEGNKSRTTWKEINSKSPGHEGGTDTVKAIAPVSQASTKSCHEMNSVKGVEDKRSIIPEREPENFKSKPNGEKSCELFKIFQVKKLKEVEDCFDNGDVPSNACETSKEVPPSDDDEGIKTPSSFPELQDDFEGARRSKSERRLKFKSHSVDPNTSGAMNESKKSPRIFQSSNVASTNSTDSSVQTSLIISIPVKTENKSLQTSLTFSEERPETPGRDIWNTSSYLFSRPLPDLSFLKNSTKFPEPRADVAPSASKQQQQQKGLTKEEATKVAKRSSSQNQNNKSTFKQTFAKSKAPSASRTSQESSGRSKSSSSFSFHSSSSSGIDPGTSDSGRQSSSGSSKDESLHSDTRDLVKTPPKPPRLFRGHSGEDLVKTATGRDVADAKGECNVPARVSGRIVGACKEPSLKTMVEVRNAKNMVRGNQGNQLGRKSPLANQEKPDPASKATKVVMRNNNQPGYAQPTKSILVRSRSKEGRRSWSNNLSSGNAELSPAGDRASPRKRPLSVPDGTLLELTTPMQEEEKPSCGDLAEPQMDLEKDELGPRQGGEGSASSQKEEGIASSGTSAPCDQDYEKFRAKKSVSFSETISYHPTTSSLSPLESPKSPVNSLPASPDADATAQDAQKCCPETAQDSAEDVELPPNDFLVSPNISPASSLSDSSSILHPLNFDLHQKKDLAMDVTKAVEVIFKHIGRCKDPLAKAKLCSTVDNPKIGNLLLEHLCPSIHAIVLDGIKPSMPGLFGKVKSSACKVFEDSLEGSPFDSLNHLMKSMKDLKFLSNPWLKFNAYLFALLNLKVLDMWLASLRRNRPVLSRYYSPTSFLQLGGVNGGSNPACQALLLDVIASLQPLSQIQFRLEYDFEVNIVEKKRQAFIAEQLLNKHISCSGEVHAETESYLTRMYETFSLDSSSASGYGRAAQARHRAAASLYCDGKNREPRGREATEESSEPSIFLLWSSVDFGGLARGLLQKTQNKLIKKLSQSRDMFSFDSSNGASKAGRSQNERSMSELTSSQRQAQPFSSSDSFVPNQSPDVTHSDCSKSYPSSAARRQTPNQRGTVDASGACEQGEDATATPCQASPCGKRVDEVSDRSSGQSETSLTQSSGSERGKSVDLVAHTRTSPPLPATKAGTPPGMPSPSIYQKSKPGLLSSYGNKIVDVFDRLLLSNPDERADGGLPFIIKKKYHSEDQISRHIADSPKNNLASRQSGQGLAKSVSCETDGRGPCSKPRDRNSTMLASSNESGRRSARSLCHYVAMNGQFLSFEKDARMDVVKEVGHDFLLCRLDGQEGLVYKVCVSVV